MLRQWDFYFAIERNIDTPIHTQIINKIITHIKNGQFCAGMVLPGSRALAANLSVNRKTVIHAYDELIAEGWLECSNRKGTFVANRLPANTTIKSMSKPLKAGNLLSKNNNANQLLHIDFSQQESKHFQTPSPTLSKAYRHASALVQKKIEQQQFSLYASELHVLIAKNLHIQKSVPANFEHILTVSNRENAIWLCAMNLKNAKECIAVSGESHPQVIELLRKFGHQVLIVKQHQHGIDLMDLEKLCINYNIKLFYIPTSCKLYGPTELNKKNGEQLLQLANRFSFKIIEDDRQSDLSITSNQFSLLKAADSLGNVIYISTLCDWLLPDLNIAYILSNSLIDRSLKHFYHQELKQSNLINELTVFVLFESGEMRKLLKHMRQMHQQKKRLVYDLLRSKLNDYLVDNPELISEQSLCIRLRDESLDKKLTSDRFLSNNLTLIPPIFSDSNNAEINLNFLHLSETEIQIGVSRFEQLMRNS